MEASWLYKSLAGLIPVAWTSWGMAFDGCSDDMKAKLSHAGLDVFHLNHWNLGDLTNIPHSCLRAFQDLGKCPMLFG